MNMSTRVRSIVLAAGLGFAAATTMAAPPETAITYQGVLSQNGSLVDSQRDFRFRLYDAETGGNLLGTVQAFNVDVVDGVFSAEMDFGVTPWVLNEQSWIQIEAGPANGSQSYELIGRQKMTAVPFALNTRGVNTTSSGVVGIGTRFPKSTSKLTVSDGDVAGNAQGESPLVVSRSLGSGYINVITAGGAGILMGDASNAAKGGIVYSNQNNSLDFRNNGNQVRMFIDSSGRVGVGTSSPQETLHVQGGSIVVNGRDPNNGSLQGEVMRYFIDSNGNPKFFAYNYTTGQAMDMQFGLAGGKVGIGGIAPTTTLDVNGALTIRGGADIVEGFDSVCGTAFEPGTVLVIDPSNPGMLMCSQGAYDKKVAGVVSGAGGVEPGIKLGQDGVMDGELPVAMTGRVYVKCSAENGTIEPGDLLTTALLAGHAMKATDDARSNGTVIGKAMGSLDADTGLVLVLVNLQ